MLIRTAHRTTCFLGAGLLACLLLTTGRAADAGTLSTVTDPAGDASALRTLFPHPDPGRSLAISGSSATVKVPRWLLGNPGSLAWVLGTYDFDGTNETQYDQIPDQEPAAWSDPFDSTAEDPADAGLDPTRDLRRAGISPSGSGHLSFAWEFAGSVATGARFGYSTFNLDGGSRYVGIGPRADGTWYSYVQSGSVPFPWTAGAFGDVVAAEIDEGTGGRLDLGMTLAGAVPASFAADDASPVIVWFFDADGNATTGGSGGVDVNAQVRYNRTAGHFEAALRVWTGRQFEDLPGGVEAFAVSGDRVTLATRVGALGLSRSFRWTAAVHMDVGPPDDLYQNRVDATGSTAMTLSEDPGTEPGLTAADAWIFPLSFPLSDPRFAAALEDLLINSDARTTVQSALGCAQVVCSVGDVVTAVSAALAQGPAGLLRIAPLAERLGTGPTPAAFTASLSPGNDRLSGLVFLDFLGAGTATPSVYASDLTLCVQSTGAAPCSVRTLLTAAELQALDPQKSYVIVPRFTSGLPASTCLYCGATSVTLQASTSVDGTPRTAAASVALNGGTGASSQTLQPQRPGSIDPEPQNQAQSLIAYLEFPAAGNAGLVRTKPASCTVDVIVREADGEVSSRTTVPALGLQGVDLGLRPPDDWKLELTSNCRTEVYVSLEERSYRGIRPCDPGEDHLCLGAGGRFRVEVAWRDFTGHAGAGHALPVTADTGAFWFFGAENIELLVKVLDGATFNGNFWVFYGALSSVEYEIRVTDTRTGAVRTYLNPSGTLASAGNTSAFAAGTAAAPGVRAGSRMLYEPVSRIAGALSGTCAPSSNRLCLGGARFAVEVSWQDFSGNTGTGQAVAWTGDTGLFWFFGPDNLELAVKVLDGTGVNGHHWVFYGALSNVAYTVKVTDTATGAVRRYENPAGRFASTADTEAF